MFYIPHNKKYALAPDPSTRRYSFPARPLLRNSTSAFCSGPGFHQTGPDLCPTNSRSSALPVLKPPFLTIVSISAEFAVNAIWTTGSAERMPPNPLPLNPTFLTLSGTGETTYLLNGSPNDD